MASIWAFRPARIIASSSEPILAHDYRDGSSRYVLTYTREKTILRLKFVDALHGIQRLAAYAIGFDGAYLRFAGNLSLERYEGDKVVETHAAPALWELMYFGKVDPRASAA